MEPIPFFSLVTTRGPGTHVNPYKPVALGVVLGRSEGPEGWGYAVLVGEQTYGFDHEELILLGAVVDRTVIYGTTEDLEALPIERRVVPSKRSRGDIDSCDWAIDDQREGRVIQINNGPSWATNTIGKTSSRRAGRRRSRRPPATAIYTHAGQTVAVRTGASNDNRHYAGGGLARHHTSPRSPTPPGPDQRVANPRGNRRGTPPTGWARERRFVCGTDRGGGKLLSVLKGKGSSDGKAVAGGPGRTTERVLTAIERRALEDAIEPRNLIIVFNH